VGSGYIIFVLYCLTQACSKKHRCGFDIGIEYYSWKSDHVLLFLQENWVYFFIFFFQKYCDVYFFGWFFMYSVWWLFVFQKIEPNLGVWLVVKLSFKNTKLKPKVWNSIIDPHSIKYPKLRKNWNKLNVSKKKCFRCLFFNLSFVYFINKKYTRFYNCFFGYFRLT